jgi:hypothetical protein
MSLSPSDLTTMTVPAWEQAKASLADGDADRAIELIDVAVERWRSLQDYSVNWITSLLSFIGEELGEEAVERALRRTGDEFVRPRRPAGPEWESLSAEVRAKAIARAMLANFGECTVEEDDDKITLRFRCGTGGRLIDEGRYDAGYLSLRETAPRTFMRSSLPVYCAHCSVNNEIQPTEQGGVPVSVEHPPDRAGDECVHHVYRDPRRAPAETWVRIGFPPDIMEADEGGQP